MKNAKEIDHMAKDRSKHNQYRYRMHDFIADLAGQWIRGLASLYHWSVVRLQSPVPRQMHRHDVHGNSVAATGEPELRDPLYRRLFDVVVLSYFFLRFAFGKRSLPSDLGSLYRRHDL
jgi:hypothetical protein